MLPCGWEDRAFSRYLWQLPGEMPPSSEDRDGTVR